MKRILLNLILFLIAAFIPLSSTLGQEKKTEEKVKIVIADKGETKTIIDTTFTGDSMPDSIVLESGKVVYLAKHDGKIAHIKTGDENGKIFVTTSVSSDDGEKAENKVIVISDGKAEWTVTPSSGNTSHVYAYTESDDNDSKASNHIIISADTKGDIIEDAGGKKVIIIKDGKVITDSDSKKFDIEIRSDSEKDTEMTKYVIAKDGVVITVETDDEAKAQDIINDIKKKLDIKASDTEKKETSKKVNKKSEKQ
jgi:hypothetical protein